MPAAKDLGQKWTCFKCATKFYDLKKAAAVCPKCGADQREAPAKPTPAAEARAAKKAAAAALREVVAVAPKPAAEAEEHEGEPPEEEAAEEEEEEPE